MVSVWPQWWQAVGGPRGKIWDLVAFVWPIRSRVIIISLALVRCWNFFGGPSVGLQYVVYKAFKYTPTIKGHRMLHAYRQKLLSYSPQVVSTKLLDGRWLYLPMITSYNTYPIINYSWTHMPGTKILIALKCCLWSLTFCNHDFM